jgi:hypothetical protein
MLCERGGTRANAGRPYQGRAPLRAGLSNREVSSVSGRCVRKMRRIAEKLVECAMKGEGWAISQVADRIDGKATAEIQTEQRHRYVIEAPAQLTHEQWIQKYSPSPPIGTSTPSDESLVLSNE